MTVDGRPSRHPARRPGETPWQAAVRECHEETGLTLDAEPSLPTVHFLPPLGD
ncbi:NUDIX domain-containing protein [Streptomyces sp. NL15-2K]|uniref:NUDIX domain-containing protein n=1 Tax=Streptomyces sp. NL15-2K TaxID=376149 RepID=UPI000FFA523B|nr:MULTISPECIES: NUDIX hydrolase [Actinomycetes]WKX06771.1 NUDIX hydrolase [Kutzneria buriramensis]GCB43775.1 hypothetical protein SNL152K_1060 [Streptomyces sp. NL15-2K]